MTNPYEAIVQKYRPGTTPTQGALPTYGPSKPASFAPAKPATTPAPATKPLYMQTPTNPYEEVAVKYAKKRRQATLTAQDEQAQKDIESTLHPGIKAEIGQAVRALPGAAAQVVTEPFKNPKATAFSLLAGLANLGPTIVRAVGGITGVKALKEMPNPGDTEVGGEIANAIKKKFNINTDSDVQNAIRTATTQTAAYELGGGALKAGGAALEARAIGQGGAAALKILTPATRVAIAESPILARVGQLIGPGTVLGRVLGNVVGGQLTTEAEGKDRLKQAAFDAAFGLVTEGAIHGTKRAIFGKAPEILSRADMKSPGIVQPPKTEAKTEMAPITSQATDPNIKYIQKESLGKDPTGEKVLARTETDSKTGRAIVYYDKSLDADAALKKQVIDHEYGHIIDKRVNGGKNLSSELPNYKGNQVNLDAVLTEFAKTQNAAPEEIASKLKSDIDTLAQGSNSGEQFANAVAEYLHDPAAAKAKAPTFSAFLEHNLGNERFTENVTTQKTLAPAEGGGQIATTPEKPVTTGEQIIEPKKPEPVVHKTQKQLEQERFAERPSKVTLTQEKLTGNEFKGIPPENIVHFNQGANPRVTVIVPALDKEVLSAMKLGSKPALYNYVLKEVMRIEGLDDTAARSYMRERSQYLKDLARANADKNNPVLLNVVEKPPVVPESAPVAPEIPKVGAEVKPTKVMQDVTTPKTSKVVDVEKLAKYDEGLANAHDSMSTMKDDFGPLEKYAKRGPTGLELRELDKSRIKDGDIEWSKFEKYGVTDWEELRTAFEKYQEAKKAVQKLKSDRAQIARGELALTNQGIEQVNKELAAMTASEPNPADLAAADHISQPTKKVSEKAPAKKSGLIAQTGLDTEKVVETKGFNPKSVNAPDEVVTLLDDLAQKGGNDQRISKNNADIKDLARITGLTEEQLIKAKPGSIANSETVTAARQLVLDKAQELMNYVKSVDMSVATPAQLKELRDNVVKLIAMQKTVAGFRTEASNVFRSLGIALQPGENATLAELGKTIKELGLASGDDAAVFAGNLAKKLELTKTQKIGQGALSTWYSAILSGPKTTVRNILSTGANILTDLASKAANPKQWTEIPAAVSGLFRGLKEGWGEAKNVLKGEAYNGKFAETGRALQPEVFTGKWKTYGSVVESVGRFLSAQDKFLSAGAREMERAAIGGKLDAELSDAISRAYAESTVYHGLPKGNLIQAVREGAQAARRKFPLLKVIIPFVDTVANVLDRQFDYIPVFSELRLRDSVLRQQAERIVKENGLAASATEVIIKRLRDQQIGRAVLGTAVSAAAVSLAAAGRISGTGPTNVNERNQLQETGWRPNSIKIGDTWVPYANLGPLAGIFSMAGNVYDKTHYDGAPNKDIVSLLGKGIVGWSQTQLNSSFLSGTADLLDVLKGGADPATYLKRLGVGLIPIPAAYTQTKDMLFRQQYETRGIQEQIALKLGLTENLQPKLNAFGQPMTADLIYGVTPVGAKKDPVYEFLISNDLIVAKPAAGAQYSVPGQPPKTKTTLTPEEYTQYIRESGQEAYRLIKARMASLEHVPDEEKKKQVQKIVDDVRTRIRFKILAARHSKKK